MKLHTFLRTFVEIKTLYLTIHDQNLNWKIGLRMIKLVRHFELILYFVVYLCLHKKSAENWSLQTLQINKVSWLSIQHKQNSTSSSATVGIDFLKIELIFNGSGIDFHEPQQITMIFLKMENMKFWLWMRCHRNVLTLGVFKNMCSFIISPLVAENHRRYGLI